MSRFDYVKYDTRAASHQADFKAEFESIEIMIVNRLGVGRAQSLALTALEETYMWIGKAIRDDQVARGGDSANQPERG
jgi:hypothetical protein